MDHDVWMLAARGEEEIAALALARSFGLTSRQATELLRNAPCRVKRNLDRAAAETYVRALEAAGCVAEVRPSTLSSRPPPPGVVTLPPPALEPRIEIAHVPRTRSERPGAHTGTILSQPVSASEGTRATLGGPNRGAYRSAAIVALLAGGGVLGAAIVAGRSIFYGNLRSPLLIVPEACALAAFIVGLYWLAVALGMDAVRTRFVPLFVVLAAYPAAMGIHELAPLARWLAP